MGAMMTLSNKNLHETKTLVATTREKKTTVAAEAVVQERHFLPPGKPQRTLNKTSLASIEMPKPVQSSDRQMSFPDKEMRSEEEVTQALLKFFALDRDELVLSSHPLLRKFDSQTGAAPKISIDDYVRRIIHYFSQVAQTLKANGDSDVHGDMPVRYAVATLIYLDRIRARSGLQLTPLNVHRFILVGVLLAAKVLDDVQPGLNWFAQLGGITAEELAMLEVAFLEAIDYKVNIDPNLFARRYQRILGSNKVDFDLSAHRADGRLIETF